MCQSWRSAVPEPTPAYFTDNQKPQVCIPKNCLFWRERGLGSGPNLVFPALSPREPPFLTQKAGAAQNSSVERVGNSENRPPWKVGASPVLSPVEVQPSAGTLVLAEHQVTLSASWCGSWPPSSLLPLSLHLPASGERLRRECLVPKTLPPWSWLQTPPSWQHETTLPLLRPPNLCHT